MRDMIMYEVVVSRIKLRLRDNPHPTTTTGMFKLRYHGNHLEVIGNITDNDEINIHQQLHYPKRVSTASYYSIMPALSEFNQVDPESRLVIRRHVLNFARRRRQIQKANPSSVSIEADIKVVSGSYFIYPEINKLHHDWDDFVDIHRKLTADPWMLDDDDKDYKVVKYLDNNMSSYALVPCSDQGEYLRAESFTTDEVTQACTCAICLVDFEPDGEEAMVNHVLKMPCGHVFHRECIVSWILSNSAVEPEPTCPLCRATMLFLSHSDELD